MSKKVEWKWLGNNQFIPGVPARDLVVGEAKERGVESVVEVSLLYERVEEKTAEKEIKDGA